MTRGARETLMHEVVTLARAKMSRRAIARTLGISRNTVRALLADHEAKRVEPSSALPTAEKRAPRASKLDAFKPRVAELLKRFKDITAQPIYETLRDEGFESGYTAVKRYVRTQRLPARPTPSLRTPEYDPGEMAESDWSPYEVKWASPRKVDSGTMLRPPG